MKVCVDPGHGMGNATPGVFDPGAMHNPSGTREADVVLAYGLELKGVLEARGMEVFMTRDNNTSPTPVGRRASRAKTAGCDIFVSIHLNSADSSSANGPRSRITISERVFAQSGSHTVMPTNAQHGRFSLISSRQWITSRSRIRANSRHPPFYGSQRREAC